jgi:hypothetical protein
MQMRFIRTKAVVAGLGLALSLAAVRRRGGDAEGADVEVKEDAASEFEDGTRMKELADAGTVKIGVKYDQPGLGFKDAGSDIPTGFDVEMAKVLAADLGISEDKVEWIETISDNREPFLQDGPSTSCWRRTPSTRNAARSWARPARTWSPASSSWFPRTATSRASTTCRTRRSARSRARRRSTTPRRRA